jgi:hypothetical protein
MENEFYKKGYEEGFSGKNTEQFQNGKLVG